jgi:hypothetical protein
MNIAEEIRKLPRMTVGQLRTRYEEVFGETTRSCNKTYLWRRIAWRIQEKAEGGLSERARRRAEELADESDLRTRLPREAFGAVPVPRGRVMTVPMPPPADGRLPTPGSVLRREYRGRVLEVIVLEKGFEFDGKVYRSLSAVAKAVTGSHWNGFSFFGLVPGGGDR